MKKDFDNTKNNVSGCCCSEMIPPDLAMAEQMGSLWRAYTCYICKKCGKVCEPVVTSSEVLHGECLELMKQIPSGSIDAIITDPPYGTTACKWDSVIDFTLMWEQLNRIIKPNGAIVLFAGQPFTSSLIMSNIKMFKYTYTWKKSKGCNFTHAKNMPIKFTEDIVVFSIAPIGHKVQLQDRRMTYNPQGLIKVDKKWSRPQKYENGHKLKRESHNLERVIEFENYPTNILEYSNSSNKERGLHPTQKPIALMEYLIKTYTNENETVLDFTMGSGSTGVACVNTNRNFIGIEQDDKYFNIATERINNHVAQTKLF